MRKFCCKEKKYKFCILFGISIKKENKKFR